jgi:hypothetical protein
MIFYSHFSLHFYVLYSTLLHLPPLRFHCVGGCWDWPQWAVDNCVWEDLSFIIVAVHTKSKQGIPIYKVSSGESNIYLTTGRQTTYLCRTPIFLQYRRHQTTRTYRKGKGTYRKGKGTYCKGKGTYSKVKGAYWKGKVTYRKGKINKHLLIILVVQTNFSPFCDVFKYC